jgi:glycosyltransferase involved in cell wall biosynthesis
MRIAILTQYFPPEPAMKMSLLVRHLVAEGHSVQVLTALPNLPHGKLYEGYHYRLLTREELFGADVLRTFVWPYRGRNIYKRIIHFATFAASSAIGGFALKPFDVLYVYHPPLTIAIPAMLIAFWTRMPFIYDVQDIWPEAGLVAGAVRHGILYGAMSKLANFVYRRAARITVIAPEFKTAISEMGIDAEKIDIVPNCTDEHCFMPRPGNGIRARYGIPESEFVVMYAGNFGSTHGVEAVIEAAGILRTNLSIHFVFCGTGPEYNRAVAHCAEAGLKNAQFLGYIADPAELPYLYAAADLMIVATRRAPSGAVSLPSRIAAYMACERPILVAGTGAPARLVEEARCGLTCEPDNPSAIADAIERAQCAGNQLAAMGARGREFYIANLSAAKTMKTVTRLLTALRSKPPAPTPHLVHNGD